MTDQGDPPYLWVIDPRGIPYILEHPLEILDGSRPKHTNLTGGREAYVGGELWFGDTLKIFVSGGSGRYGPESPEQLEDAVSVFETFGYVVRSLEWDPQLGKARRNWERQDD